MAWNNRAVLPELHYVTRLLADAARGDIGAGMELEQIEFDSMAGARIIQRARAQMQAKDSQNAA